MQTMKQRVIDAINHKQTDVCPWNIDLTSGFSANVQSLRGKDIDVEQYLGNHLAREKYKKNVILNDKEQKDIFGAIWTGGDDGGDVGVVSHYPILGKTLDEYKFPEVKVDFVHEICKKLQNDDTGRFRMFSLTMLYYERAWSLYGMEDLLVDMCINENVIHELFDRILAHHLELLDIALEYDFDAVYFGDDWGQQRGLIMGPEKWREFIKPGMSKLYDKVKSKGKYIVQHSCGDLREIMGDLVDMGLDVYNTVQPEIYDLTTLKREYGKDLTFYGGISTQQFLPYASAEECTEIAKKTLEIMYKDGGYIFSPTHAVTPDIPVENVEALVNVVRGGKF